MSLLTTFYDESQPARDRALAALSLARDESDPIRAGLWLDDAMVLAAQAGVYAPRNYEKDLDALVEQLNDIKTDKIIVSPTKEVIIYEYGLNVPQYKILKFVAIAGEVHYPDDRLNQFSGAPANQLRHLACDLALLDGPPRGKPIRSQPFTVTEKGRELLAKIDRGLHTPAWLSEHKVKALQVLPASGVRSPVADLKKQGVRRVTLGSLAAAGYIGCIADTWYYLRPLGQEALAEWQHKE
ncbi:MAG: hypothetical protein KJ077_11795 [Anaerolineae bacterium]|nr:hypothetical protein [Anaerolineae bacterium]